MHTTGLLGTHPRLVGDGGTHIAGVARLLLHKLEHLRGEEEETGWPSDPCNHSYDRSGQHGSIIEPQSNCGQQPQ